MLKTCDDVGRLRSDPPFFSIRSSWVDFSAAVSLKDPVSCLDGAEKVEMAKVKDKATAFKNEIAGSQTNKIVCKASSHEVAGPKKKHVDCESTVS